MSCRWKLIIEGIVVFSPLQYRLAGYRVHHSLEQIKAILAQSLQTGIPGIKMDLIYFFVLHTNLNLNRKKQIQNGIWWRVENKACKAKLSSRFPELFLMRCGCASWL